MSDVIRTARIGIRRPGRVAGGLATIAMILSGCTGGDPADTNPPSAPTIPPPAEPSPDPVETPCLSASPSFTARGTVSVIGGSGPDARQLSGLDWILTPGCERIVFSFLTDEAAPASKIGLSRLEFFAEQGIVRVMMPRDVTVTGIADVQVDGALIHRAFVVRSRSGDLAVDLHVSGDTPIEARGLLIGSPARLVIDVRPGPVNEAFGTARPTIGTDVVVLSPSPGSVEYPLRIRGYARTLDDVVSATVTGSGESIPGRRITAAPSGDAWGEFAVTISEGPAGDISLQVATDRTGEGVGVSISLTTP